MSSPWWVYFLSSCGVTGFGVVLTLITNRIVTRRRKPKLIILPNLRLIHGEFRPQSANLRTSYSEKKATYYCLTVLNKSRRETAKGCLPLVFLMLEDRTEQVLGIWLSATMKLTSDFEQDLYAGQRAPFICFAVMDNNLMFYDSMSEEFMWKTAFDTDARFKIAVAMKASNCIFDKLLVINIKFSAEREAVETQAWERKLHGRPPEIEVMKVDL